MNRKLIAASILSLALMGSMVPAAMAETFQKTLILGSGAGNFAMSDLGIGDTVVLTLVNPTSAPLVFETTQNIGNNQQWTVPANSQTTIDFTYTRPFDDDVEFVVHQVGEGVPIARGTLVPRGTAVVTPTTSSSSTTTSTVTSQGEVIETPVANPSNTNVRGYW